MKKTRFAAVLAAATLTVASFTACGASDDTALVTIDNGADTISYGYAQYAAYYTQALYDLLYGESMSSDMWSTEFSEGTTMEDRVKGEVLDTLKENYYLTKHAEDYGVSFTEDEEAQMEAAVDAFLEANTEAGLTQMHATKEYVLKFFREQQLASRVQEAIEEEADYTVTDEEANQKAFSYVSWSTAVSYDDEGNLIDPTTDTIPLAETVASAIDFEAAAEEAGVAVNTSTFGQAELAEAEAAYNATEDDEVTYNGFAYELLSALDSLEEGEMTAVIQSADYIYVARLDSLHDEEATETERTTLENEKKSNHFDEVMESFQADSGWVVNEKLWAKVHFVDRFSGSLYSLTSTTEEVEESEESEETEEVEETTETEEAAEEETEEVTE